MKNRRLLFPLWLICCLLWTWSCEPKSRPLNYNKDECAFCKMNVIDPRVSAELVTHKGRVYAFDAIECMLEYYIQEGKEETFYVAYVNTHDRPRALADATKVTYLQSEKLPTPMAVNLNGYGSRELAIAAQKKYGGTRYDWETLLAEFETIKTYARSK